jgi:hypothetical protein
LGKEITTCIDHNATALEVAAALGALPSVTQPVEVHTTRFSNGYNGGSVYPVTDEVKETGGVGFDYEISFRGEYPASLGIWPLLKVPLVHFGKYDSRRGSVKWLVPAQ